jgi:hypothetical protein
MVRTQVYLTKKEKTGLESAALAQGIRQSDLIRKAVDDLLARQGAVNKSDILDEIAGVWAAKKDVPEIRKMRAGWRQRLWR